MNDLPDFTTALRAIWPHASRDYTLPTLTGVHLAGNRLYATDRYTMGRAEFDTDKTAIGNKEESLWLSPELVKMILGRKNDSVTALIYNDGRIAVTFESGVTFGISTDSPIFGKQGGDYPDLERIITSWKPAEKPAIAFTSKLMNRLADTNFPGNAATKVELGTGSTGTSSGLMRATKGDIDWFVAFVVEVRL